MKIHIDDLRKVKGIGSATIERIKEEIIKGNHEEFGCSYDDNIVPDHSTTKHSLYLGNCLDKLNGIPDNSIDLILTDPPYGTTNCFWDSIIPFDIMWKQIKRVSKKQCPAILFGSQPFSSHLILSNLNNFKYSMVWKKSKCGSPLTAKYKPLTKHEDIMVFSPHGNTLIYYPQMEEGTPYKRKYTPNKVNNMGFGIEGVMTDNKGTRHPSTILDYPQKWRRQDQTHPTQKPTELLEHIIRSHTKEGDVVLDFTMGSGSTGVACKNTNRSFIGIEMDDLYFEVAQSRINGVQ